jgi:carbamoyl-phosphate synthase small subunit
VAADPTRDRPASGAPALLALEDGTFFRGVACGARGEASGEICFNTSLSGYQEILTDPSYRGQIVTMTMPHIGNYGVNAADMESRGVWASGLVVRECSRTVSNWRADESLRDFLVRTGTVAVEGVDTRRLTRHVRERGAMRAVISTEDLEPASLAAKAAAAPGLVGRDLVSEVAIDTPVKWGADSYSEAATSDFGVCAIDSGIKYNILRRLVEQGCEVTVVPPTTGAADILAMEPDGVFVANGPGDPAAVPYLYGTLEDLIGERPVFGICLGHQMLSLAVGARTYKLKYGHRGGNQPVMNLLTGRVEITSQNHGFCVDETTLPANVQVTHRSLFDGTLQGIALGDRPAFSFQGHPEASPGPHDVSPLFDRFTAAMIRRLQAQLRALRLSAGTGRTAAEN